MLYTYLKIAYRNLIRNRVFSILNIFGLSIGLSACLLIIHYVYFELNYDTFHKNAADIYRVQLNTWQDGVLETQSAWTPPAIASLSEKEFPEVKRSSRLLNNAGGMGLITYKKKNFNEEDIYFAESAFLDMFSFPVKQGNVNKALSEPYQLILTESIARKYFGTKNPIGQVLHLESDGGFGDFKVGGVLYDIPENSHVKFNVLLSWPTLAKSIGVAQDDNWNFNHIYTYLHLNQSADPDQVNKKLNALIYKHQGEKLKKNNTRLESKLQPLRDIYLYSDLRNEARVNSNATTFFYWLLRFLS